MGFLCHLCYKVYTNRFTLDRHLMSTHAEHSYPCPRCPTSYACHPDLNEHTLQEHSAKLIWKSATTRSLVYSRDLILLDDGGILLQGRNPRYIFRKSDPTFGETRHAVNSRTPNPGAHTISRSGQPDITAAAKTPIMEGDATQPCS